MPKNIIEKIWDSHVIKSQKNFPDVFFIDLQLLHEVTTPQAFDVLRNKGKKIKFLDRNIATLDHSIPTDKDRKNFADERSKMQIEKMRENCKNFNVKLLDVDSGNQGIVHVIAPELGLVQPGMTIACGDSHTSTHGAFGALAFGIGTTQVGQILESGCILMHRPKTMKVSFVGKPNKYFSAKDAILALIQKIGIKGGVGYAIEYTGDFIKNLSMEERMTICNMSIECGARVGLISPDKTTYDFLKNTSYANMDNIDKWEEIKSDEGANFDEEVVIDLSDMKPIVTWGTNPTQSVQISEKIPDKSSFRENELISVESSLKYTKLNFGDNLEGLPVQNVFVGSCTNGRINDLRVVAEVLKNNKVHNSVNMFIVPGSQKVEKQAVKEGLDKIFKEAGADFRKPGCSACLGMNGDVIPKGERCASTSNRNFVGRQGIGSITHLMSPKMAAIVAVIGKITNPENFYN